MEKGNTCVYFELTGDHFDPQVVTDRIEIAPTKQWTKGEKGNYKSTLEYSGWKFSTDKRKEYLMVNILVDEMIGKLFDKIEVINEIKKQLGLTSVLVIVMYIDINEEESTPTLGHNQKTIEFLYHTQTSIDIDIYRFNSSKKEETKNK